MKTTDLLYHFSKFLCIVCLIGILTSCSTKKNTLTRRVFHNITAKYNGYFNGNESMKEGVALIESQHIDSYMNILPVFKYGTSQTIQSASPFMDKSIAKASKVIQKHSMQFGKKEYCKWIDDSYLLMGKAQFYKQDFALARQTFSFVSSKYNQNEIRYDAMLWLAKTTSLEGNYDKAGSALDNLQNKSGKNSVSKYVRRNFPMVLADYYLQQEKYLPSVEYLIAAIKENKKKNTKIRLTFILAQVYQKTGQLELASKTFLKVIKMNPPYEMAFQARLNMARSFSYGTGSSKDIKKVLLKMLKDDKNKEYLDEIYYALADIEIKEKNIAQGKEYLELSVAKSVSNNIQKSVSALRLADILFESQNYQEAQAYYDSTMAFLPKEFPNYSVIERKKNVLSDLVSNLIVVQTEDSLQKIAKMSPNDRSVFIDKLIAKIIIEEQKRLQEESDRQIGLQMLDQQRRENEKTTTSTTKWYFYNTSAMSFGFSEFAKKWGNRKLEDLWRLSNKQTMEMNFDENTDEDEDETEAGKQEGKTASNVKDRNHYLKNIPLTPEKIEASNNKIKIALYNIGSIYKNDLADFDRAITTFEDIENRFPEDEILAKVYFQLYRIYIDQDYSGKANNYKGLLSSKFPNSDYSKIINDPEYIKKLNSEKNKANEFYKATYQAFQDGKYGIVKANMVQAAKDYSDLPLYPKFEMLNIMAIGKSRDTATYRLELEKFLIKYPNNELSPLAQNMLESLDPSKSTSQSSSQGTSSTGTQKEQLYKYNGDDIHLYIAIIDVKKANMNELKIAFSDHNSSYKSIDKLTVSSIYLDGNRQMLTVSNFKDLVKGYSYIQSLQINKGLSDMLDKGNARQYIISVTNYSTFIKNKNIAEYQEFYDKNYLK